MMPSCITEFVTSKTKSAEVAGHVIISTNSVFLFTSSTIFIFLTRTGDTLPQGKEDDSLPPRPFGKVCSVPQPGRPGAETDYLLRLCPLAVALIRMCFGWRDNYVVCMCVCVCVCICVCLRVCVCLYVYVWVSRVYRYLQAGSERGVCQSQGLPHSPGYQFPYGSGSRTLCTRKEAGTERYAVCVYVCPLADRFSFHRACVLRH